MDNKQRRNYKVLLFVLVLLLIAIDYPIIDRAIDNFVKDSEGGVVERVIDGDTIVVNGTHIRMLGMNAPEITKKEKYSQEAKAFLENLVLNKTVRLEFGKERTDRYGRTLAYVYVDGKDVNLELVKVGLANYYFPSGKDINYLGFGQAWEECIKNNVNLCEISKDKCAECINLKEFDYNKQKIIFHNNCFFDCDLSNWDIKDEGRKHFKFSNFTLQENSDVTILVGDGENNQTNLFWKGQKYVWTKTGDTLFLRDDEGKLVLWRGY